MDQTEDSALAGNGLSFCKLLVHIRFICQCLIRFYMTVPYVSYISALLL